MLTRKLFRTILKYKAQFISMIIMIALGVGVFVGFNVEWFTIQENVSDYFEETSFADYRVYDENGFSKDDYNKILDIEGVESLTRVLAVDVGVKDSTDLLALNVQEHYGDVSSFLVTKGKAYDENSDGIWLSESYAEKNDVELGDTLTVTYKNISISGKVEGLIRTSEYLVCVAESNQIMPDYSSYGYLYITPHKLKSVIGIEFYPQVNIKSSELSKEQLLSEIENKLERTVMVLSNDENMSYAAVEGEIEEGKTMGSILPVLFLLIALLTMVTTMHRICANEKTQIGTLKALGFRNNKILFHYTLYGLFIGIIGALLGIGLGFGIAAFIMKPNGAMSIYFDLPSWNLVMPWFCMIVVVVMVAVLTLIGFLSVKNMLRGTAADTLRPYAPKKVKKSAIEKTKVWNKLSFGTKWNFRDVVRHKSRSFMTLFGIIGCMILLVGGMGMKDTMSDFTSTLYDDVMNYETRVNLADTSKNEKARELAETLNGDYVATSSVEYAGKAISLEIYNADKDKIRFIDENDGLTTLTDDGAYICVRIANSGVKIGDSINFSPYGSDVSYSVTVVGIIRSSTTESIVMTETYADNVGIPYKINSIFTDKALSEIEANSIISGTQSKQSIVDSYDSFMELMNTMVFVLVLAAIILGIVVLYNLGVMSYTERYRELATLKVVGFRDKHIGKILIGQNVWLTITGILIGLPAGYGVLSYLISAFAGEYELKLTMGVLTYLVSILLTFVVSLVVAVLVANKNKKIDMVEALKGVD